MNYPKRLIEVDFPMKAVSAHARREKSIRHGHISTLHIWWARRPLAACRAVLCAALWPDPADALCPPTFREQAAAVLSEFARNVRQNAKLSQLCRDHWNRWNRINESVLKPDNPSCWSEIRYTLLDFIADFANWDAATVPEFLDAARSLTQAAHEALGGMPDSRPLVVDPFAGGGSIPLEALRVGADAFASDLNPVAVLLNKVVLEYIPKYGRAELTMPDADGQPRTFHGLAEAVRYWGNWIKEQAEAELREFYPKDDDGATPIAYLWARTITCDGPGCGAEVPLIKSLWLAKKAKRSVALKIFHRRDAENAEVFCSAPSAPLRCASFDNRRDAENAEVFCSAPSAPLRCDFSIFTPASAKEVGEGTVKRGAATCPCCGYTTPVESVRKQLKARRGGAHDARLFAVVTTKPGQQGRFYRLPTDRDLEAVRSAAAELERRKAAHSGELSLVPDEDIPLTEIRRISVPLYGLEKWGDLFTQRQLLALTTLISYLQQLPVVHDFFNAIKACLTLAISRQSDYSSSLCTWHLTGEKINHTFGRQALPIMWDFIEVFPFSQCSGDFNGALEWIKDVLEKEYSALNIFGHIEMSSATLQRLPDDTAKVFFTDPPYYDAVPYAHLSDFFYVWLKRMLGKNYPDLFTTKEVDKTHEIVVDRPHTLSNSTHDIEYYERELTKAFAESRRILAPDGIGVIVFASKTMSSWEAILQAVVSSGWMITGSWPIDTEMGTRMNAIGTAALASSIHLVCRPRETSDGRLIENVGDWRDVLRALPQKMRDWMPRLAQDGVVGADAIFACIGPALEIFSQYARVEKASGEAVTLHEYLEEVWAAVSKEALDLLFEGAHTNDFEPDARLTAMWLWTLSTDKTSTAEDAESAEELEDNDAPRPSAPSAVTYTLDYDTARKIGQGIGAVLEKLPIVELKGDKARLLGVAERRKALLGSAAAAAPRSVSPGEKQSGLFAEFAETAPDSGVAQFGATTLDRVHQSMLLFADGRGDALRRFLVDDGVGSAAAFWKLADCLSKLYPPHSDEKRWVDGVLARKKGLGL